MMSDGPGTAPRFSVAWGTRASRIAVPLGVIGVAVLVAAPAFADDGYYIEGTGAAELGTDVELAGINVGTDSGYRISGAAGRCTSAS